MEEKVAIVTGAGKGIGAEIARHLLAKKLHVVIAEKDLRKKEWSLEDSSRALFLKTDVSREASVKAMVRKTVKKFGRIDFVINNAGLLPDKLPSIDQMPLKTWQSFIDTNLTAAFLTSKYAVPYLEQNGGVIINIASTRFMQSEGNDIPYSASKGGLVSLTHSLAIALGPKIRVNCISPGWIHTEKTPLKKKDHEQHPVGRVGEPEDIAAMVAFLISDMSEFITGQNFIVDGGMTVKMVYQ